MKTGFNGASGVGGSSIQRRRRQGKAVARRRWHLTPAAVVATAGRRGSSVGIAASVSIGIGVGAEAVTAPAAGAAFVGDNGNDSRGDDGDSSYMAVAATVATATVFMAVALTPFI